MAIGSAARSARSAASMVAATSAAVAPGGTAIFAATSSSSGATCSVLRWMIRSMPGADATASRMRATDWGVAASPRSRLLTSMPRITATDTSSAPMTAEPTTSKYRLWVSSASPTPANATARPSRAARSSSRMTGSSGAFARRMNAHQLWSPRTLFVSMMAVRNESDSMTIARPSTISGTYFQRLVSRPPSS